MEKQNQEYAIQFINITKKFGDIIANNDITINIKKGTIHALIGENGAGKSTLMSILFGLYSPTSGSIKIDGHSIYIKDPNLANEVGIGMVHQHFKLVNAYTNLDNIILGSEIESRGFLDKKTAIAKIIAIQNKYNLHFDLNQKTGNATVGTQQKVEIMKMLYRDAEVLIFDEPTAVLTPQEISGLLETMKIFRKNGKTIIFISHKLNEVKEVADEATVIRHGKVVGHFEDPKNASISELSEAMVGKKVVMPKNDAIVLSEKIGFEFKNVSAKHQKSIHNVSFNIKKGEILAIAGVEGNGQEEIEFIASGILKPKEGHVFIYDEKGKKIDITNFSVAKKKNQGISYIPGDRHKYGLVLDFSILENSIIRQLDNKLTQKLLVINNKNMQDFYNKIETKYDVRGGRNGHSKARSLSGGNQQKAIVGREMLSDHNFIIIVQPTRGLDVGAINIIHNKILEEKAHGKAILLISYELDEVLALADSVIVINKGRVSEKRSIKNITRTEIGKLMAGVNNE
ncbi:ABC transporter ATP-binding protein [Mycoplasma phocimorsus]|uniref:ABC transporter ATP-binding protein n=1 Tax=Mycoplasma phocimorsus TaxID=3045839 RepID=UPI0024BF2995|nr:ABC transporter ATP-binding protein [Mycoplasma phocimorsus]MDJ1646189.1 ABC transporter ATP-binding protein [Mycoplasma phocimorsus]MDJ1648295.1 ABC transporter ATP-binding protein [Mycoplasma phocimorsus]MDJ1648682.1 ABC transporter ATP-binding protein [Mycoplasma phocimorsus]